MQDLLSLLQAKLEPHAIDVALVKPGHVVLRGSATVAPVVSPQWLLPWLEAKLAAASLTVEFVCPENPNLSWQRQFGTPKLLPEQIETDALPLVAPAARSDRFLVCGLGRLGRYCVQALGRFGGAVTAIDLAPLSEDNFEELQSLTAQPWVGDCRSERLLKAAGVLECRAILVVTSDDGINLATALTAQKLNPQIRLVVRSSKQNLNQLLQQRLRNFVAYDPNELPAAAFTLAALGEETLGLFEIDSIAWRIVRRRVRPNELYDRYVASRLHKRHVRLLDIIQPRQSHDSLFHQWHPEQLIRAGDEIIYIEQVPEGREPAAMPSRWWEPLVNVWQHLKALDRPVPELVRAGWHWLQASRLRRSIAIAIGVGIVLGISTAIALRFNVPDLTWQESVNATIVLLLGGYGDVFEGLQREIPIPNWVLALCLMTTLMSLVFVLGVVGLLADEVVSTRFQFFQQRARIPQRDHIVIFGLGRIGRQIIQLLQTLKQPLLIISENPEQASLFPNLPMLTGTYTEMVARANVDQAKSALMVTDDQLLNLELALMAQEQAPGRPLSLVVRTQDRHFSESLAQLLPAAQGLCAYALSAEAFAGAALGEHILGLCRLHDRTVMLVEYTVEAGDTLHHKLIAQVAYGYGLVPILHQRAHIKHWLPVDDERLRVGDRLIVLATTNGLKRVERGQLPPVPRWRLSMLKPLSPSVLFEAAGILHRITGCELNTARAFLLALPGNLELSLYEHQAARLWQQLRSMKSLPVKLERLTPASDGGTTALPTHQATLGPGE